MLSSRDKALLFISVNHIIDCNMFILCDHITGDYNCILPPNSVDVGCCLV